MKNILVPTDFSQQSLEAITQVAKKQQHQPVNIHLVHMVQAPTDFADLVFLNKKKLYDYVPRQFFQSIDNLKSKYSGPINSIRFEFYYGSRAGILKSIVENLKIDEICVIDGYNYRLPLEESVNIIPFIERCQVPLFKVPLTGKVNIPDNAKQSTFVARESLSASIQ